MCRNALWGDVQDSATIAEARQRRGEVKVAFDSVKPVIHGLIRLQLPNADPVDDQILLVRGRCTQCAVALLPSCVFDCAWLHVHVFVVPSAASSKISCGASRWCIPAR